MKLSYVLAAVALPVALSAQQPGGSPPANPITTAFRGRMLGLQRNIAQAFDSIPESRFGYKPTPAQLTVGNIAQHLASDNYLFCGAFGPLPPTISDEEKTTPDSVKATWPKAKLVERLKTSLTYCENALAQVDDAKLTETAAIPGPNGQTRNVVRVNMVLGHVLDLADHYSQIANYMRLNNILPPSALPRPRP
jgi:hypothetical protein